jgi:hypothetical protein
MKIKLQLRKDFTQKQAECGRGTSFNVPSILFISKESLLADMETHELTLWSYPNSVGTTNNNTFYMLMAKVFQSGSTEDPLFWLDEQDTIFCKKTSLAHKPAQSSISSSSC